MYDLALSEHGDLVFHANRDLLGVSGRALVEQRITTRLRVMRGSWIYDNNDTFGSQLHRLPGQAFPDAEARAGALVREALRDMDDVSVSNVITEPDDHGLIIHVQYGYVEGTSIDTTADVQIQGSLEISVPVGG